MSRKILVRWKCDVCGKKVVTTREKVRAERTAFADKKPSGWAPLWNDAGDLCEECAQWIDTWKENQGRDNSPIKARRRHLHMDPDKEPDD